MTDQLKRAINAAQTAQINDAQAEATRIASSSAGEQTFDMSETTYKTSHTAVRKARRFAMQGLYERYAWHWSRAYGQRYHAAHCSSSQACNRYQNGDR